MSDDVTSAVVAKLNARVGIDFSAPEWHTISPALSALAMRERAAEVAIQRKGIGSDTMPHPYDAGYLAACDDCANVIRALPTTFTETELLAAAMQLPEVRALVASADKIDDEYCGQEYGPTLHSIDGLRAALAPFMKGAS